MASKKIIPEELQNIIDEVQNEITSQETPVTKNSFTDWDVKLDDPVEYFDPELSYEITGYRPITKTKGLDFNPEWFIETRKYYETHNKYCPHLPKSKKYDEFWREQYHRCKYGMTVNGYTITGDNYFFLNFYQLPLANVKGAAGEGLDRGFPVFFESHYRFFHYLQMTRILHRHAALMKARSIGFSEINASLAARLYTVNRRSRTMITCFKDDYIKTTFSKFDTAITFLNNNTQGGMFKPRLIDKELHKKSGFQRKVNGQYEDQGFQSEVIAINGSKPSNIRGDRVDLLIFDEAGSWPGLTTAIIQGQELCEIQGVPRGIMLYGGTGGDMGAPLEGLKKIYYNPKAFKVLPYRHNYTQTGEYELTGFFIPYFAQALNPIFMDHRGVCDMESYKKVLQDERNNLLAVPEEYYKKCAERCWFAEEAFNLEGVNKFNKTLISDQLAEIRLHKRGPKPEKGNLEYIFKTGKQTKENIEGFKWTPNVNSKLQILEHPIWTNEFKHSPTYKYYDQETIGTQYTEMKDLYIAGVDGIDIGANDTSKETRDPSDFCIVILKRIMGMQEPQIVAMYKDRPGDEREAFKIAIRLCQYYNAKINIEATRKSFYTWAKDRGYGPMFVRRPKATMTSDLSRALSNQIGTPATKQIIEQHTSLTANFIEDYCHTIWFEEILNELISYNDENKTKFDIVASLGMVFLLDQELSSRVPTEVKKEVEEFEDFGYYIDERGYKRWGVIPKPDKELLIRDNRNAYDPRRIDSSDPRHHQILAQSGVHW